MIRIVLADDHPVVRTGYRRLLEQGDEMRVVAEAGDGDTAYAAFVAHAPDVLVTDLAMPGGGLELVRRVLQRDARARVLVFSMHDTALPVRKAFDAGALGFQSKAGAPEGLVDAVRSVHARRRFLGAELPPEWLRRDGLADGDRLAALSAREFEIFRLLAQGCSPADCARELNLSAKTVSNHQSAIKDKLGVATLAGLAHLAMRHGVIAPAAV